MQIYKTVFIALLSAAVMLTSCKKENPGSDSHTPIKMTLADSCHIKVEGEVKAKKYFTYNAYGLPVETRRVKVDGNGFVNDTLVRRTFDRHRNVLTEELYIWNNGFWNTYNKSSYTYDDKDRKLTYERFKGNGDAAGWSAQEKHEYGYDNSDVVGKHNVYTHQSEDIFSLKSSLSASVNPETELYSMVTEYTYDNNGVKTPEKRSEFERYESGKVQYEYIYKYKDGVWVPYSKSSFKYDACGKVAEETGFVFDQGEYKHDLSDVYAYTSDGKLTRRERSCRLNGEDTMTKALTIENEYNETGKIVKAFYKAVDGKFRDVPYIHNVQYSNRGFKYNSAGNLIEESLDSKTLIVTGFENCVIDYYNSEHVF